MARIIGVVGGKRSGNGFNTHFVQRGKIHKKRFGAFRKMLAEIGQPYPRTKRTVKA